MTTNISITTKNKDNSVALANVTKHGFHNGMFECVGKTENHVYIINTSEIVTIRIVPVEDKFVFDTDKMFGFN